MDKVISAAGANRNFSQVLREVKEGRSFVVTSHGKPVARIAPLQSGSERSSAKAALLKRLRNQPVIEIGRWDRDELYERDPK
jgi:prevent-host-death family protein